MARAEEGALGARHRRGGAGVGLVHQLLQSNQLLYMGKAEGRNAAFSLRPCDKGFLNGEHRGHQLLHRHRRQAVGIQGQVRVCV